MEFMRRAKGSISIFLCIILMPMVTYSTMIIDASRMQVARTNIATAGDLAMNAALSEYEKVLQDMYGLFSVAQSEGDFEEQLKVYFTESLEGKFHSAEKDSKNYVENGAELITGAVTKDKPADKIENLTNLLLMSADELDYQTVPGSTLANQAIMKRQIIEYMKYKGPVSLATTLLPKLDFLKDSSKQTEVVKKKVEYTKTLDSLQDACNEAWLKVEGYLDPNMGDMAHGYNKLAIQFNDFYNGYNDEWTVDGILRDARKNFGDMTTILLMKRQLELKTELSEIIEREKNQDNYDKMKNEFFEEVGVNAVFSARNSVDVTNFESIKAYLEKVEAAHNNIVNLDLTTKSGKLDRYVNFKDVNGKIIAYDKGSGYTEDMIIIDEIYSIINDDMSKFSPPFSDEAIQKINQLYEKQNNCYEKAIEVFSDANRERYRTLRCSYDALDKLCDEYLWAAKEYDTLYGNEHTKMLMEVEPDVEAIRQLEDNEGTENNLHFNIHTKMVNIFTAWQINSNETDNRDRAITSRRYYEHIFGGDDLKEANLSQAYVAVDVYKKWAEAAAIKGRTKLREYDRAVEGIINACTEAIDSLDNVIVVLESIKTAKDDWQGSIGELADGATKSSMQSDFNTTTDSIKPEEVNKLINVFKYIKGVFEKRDKQIHAVKFFKMEIVKDEAVINPDTYNDIENNIFHSLGDANTGNGTLNGRTSYIMKNHYDDSEIYEGAVPHNGAPLRVEPIVLDGNDEEYAPYLSAEDEASQKFYATLKSICETKKPEMTTEQQTQIDNINDSAQGNKPDDSGISPTSPAHAAEPTENPKDQEYSDEVKAIDIGAIYTEIKGVASENGFPDPTEDPNNTGEPSVNGMKIDTDKSKYNDKDDKKGKASEGQDSLDAGTSILSSIADLGGKIVDCAYLEEYFTEMFTCRTDRESNGDIILLNGYAIPAPGEASLRTVNRNTPWFGKEIEYIIWGDSELKGNWAKTDALIYTIRFALNAIYAFTAQDIQIFAAQVATAIAGWTVIGVPIVQACVTLAIAAAESAYDLVLLHQGKDVAIYKNSTTFVCSPTGMVSKIGKEVAIKMIEDAADKAAEAIDNKIDEISNMANDKIEEKRQAAVDYVAEYTKEQANQINTTVANMSVVPLMNALMPIATDFDNTANATVDQIKEDLEKAVDAAFEAITNSISDMPNDSIVKTVAGYVYTEELKDKLRAEVINHFNENVNPENYSAVDKLYSLKDYLIDDEIGESEPNGVISKAIYNKKTEITELFTKKSEELTKKITDLKDEQIGNLKNVLHEGIDDMSGKITGTVTKSLEGAAENLKLDKVKDASASTGFTLNYKEYCKIFVLVKLAAGQEPKMLNRAAALIEANVKTANGVNNPEFQIINAYTLVSIKSKVRMGTLFPWGVSVEDASGITGSVDLSLDMENFGENFVTINYQAVNGY